MSFLGASNFVISNANFINHQAKEDGGLHGLYTHSLLDATHDSRAQEISAMSLPKSQYENIVDVVARWTAQPSNPVRSLWLSGPKSSLAHLCAQQLEDHLAATFFFSRKNCVEDPARFFTTISFQLAILFPAYGTILASRLRQNPALLSKRLEVQFRELISRPFQQLLMNGEDIGDRRLILVEGLDECKGLRDRCEILRIIATSARELPFRWLILSRPIPTVERRLLDFGLSYVQELDAALVTSSSSQVLGNINHSQDVAFGIAVLHLGRADGWRLYLVIGLVSFFN